MKKTSLALVLTAGAAAVGCAKAEQPPTPTPPPAVAVEPAVSPSPTPAPDPVSDPTAGPAPAPDGARLSASRQAEEECVDRWLEARRLDRYGSPQGTMYTGGTPLFDERTGERRDRLQHVYKLHPPAREACRPTAVH